MLFTGNPSFLEITFGFHSFEKYICNASSCLVGMYLKGSPDLIISDDFSIFTSSFLIPSYSPNFSISKTMSPSLENWIIPGFNSLPII